MSDNALFLFDNAADAGTITASSAVAAMPASNLLDPQRSAVWRSSGASPQTVDITLASGNTIPIGAVAVVDHNLTPVGTIRLQGWLTGIAVGTAEVDVTVDPWDTLFGYGVGGYGVYGYGGEADAAARKLLRPVTFIPLLDFSELRYWRLTFTDASLAYIQAGRVYVGGIWQPQENISYGWRLSRTGRTRSKESRGGQVYGNPRASRVTLDASLDWLSESDRAMLQLYYLIVEDHTPFIVCMRPVGGVDQLFTAIYGRFSGFDITENRFNNATAPLRIVEDL